MSPANTHMSESESETDFDSTKPSKRVREEPQSPESPTLVPPKKRTMAPYKPIKPDTSVADGFNTLNENLAKMRDDFQKQFDNLNTKIDHQFTTWQQGKGELIAKQTELESRLDRLERH